MYGGLDKLDCFYLISLMAFSLFGMAFSMFNEYDEDGALTSKGLFDKEYEWLKDPLTWGAVLSVGLASFVTALDVLKELRKKYLWQKSLSIYIEKAIKMDYDRSQSKQLLTVSPFGFGQVLVTVPFPRQSLP